MTTSISGSAATRKCPSRHCFAFVIFLLGGFVANRLEADAIVVTRAMKAATVAEFFVEEDRIRFEIEVGQADLPAFANALSDQEYERATGRHQPQKDRLSDFFGNDWRVIADGEALAGTLESITPAQRVIRDEVTGDPLAVQPKDAPRVIRFRLIYPLDARPRTLVVRPPVSGETPAASIGFVCYHQGLPVNDFRYLPAEVTLDLDWDDPWYSRFRHPNLKRQFKAPLSAFLYVEPYEVRKEIVVRPQDLQSFIDLDLHGDAVIPVGQQEQLKRRVAEFLADKNPVEIDGQLAKGRIDRIHFIRRTLKSTGIVDPPVDLDAVSATLGVIYVYPVERLPRQVKMTCDLFTTRIQSIPAVASDEAGGLPTTLTPEDPVLVWKNYLIHPSDSELIKVASPPVAQTLAVPLVSVLCGFVSAILIAVMWQRMRTGKTVSKTIAMASVAMAVSCVACVPIARISITNPLANAPLVSEQESSNILSALLHNVYRAFDHHDEGLIYDRLAKSISGDLLADVYLKTRRSMEVKNQGGLRISVKEVVVTELEPTDASGADLTYRCGWRVRGWIGHWGHIHARENQHMARITISDRDGSWKITAMEILDQSPTEPRVTSTITGRGNDA